MPLGSAGLHHVDDVKVRNYLFMFQTKINLPTANRHRIQWHLTLSNAICFIKHSVDNMKDMNAQCQHWSPWLWWFSKYLPNELIILAIEINILIWRNHLKRVTKYRSVYDETVNRFMGKRKKTFTFPTHVLSIDFRRLFSIAKNGRCHVYNFMSTRKFRQIN